MNIKKETVQSILVAIGIFLIISIVLCALSISDDSSIGSLLDEIDDRFGDSRFEWREKSGLSPIPSNDIAILVVDEESVNEMGRWPWSRKVQAEMLQSIYEYNPRIVALDIVNSESINEEHEKILSEVIKNNKRNIVLGYFYRYNEPTEDNSDSFKYVKRSKINIIKKIEETEPRYSESYWKFRSVEVNIPILGKNSRGHGFFNFKPDSDGIFRKSILLTKFDENFYPALSLEALKKFMGGQVILSLDRFGVEGLYINDLKIPVNESGSLILNFYGQGGTINTYSIVDVINKKLHPDTLKDKLVFVGVTEIGLYDIRPSPLDGVFPGVELQATAASNVLNNDFLIRNSYTELIDLILIISFSFLILLLLLIANSTVTGFLVLAGLLGIHLYSNYLAFVNYNYLLSSIYPIFSLVLSFLFFEIFRNLVVERQSRFLRRAFSNYVSPDLVSQIISDPEKLGLGGVSKNVTLLFSDIRGFTSLSEKLSPQELVSVLNEYLSPMTDIVMANKGTLDKYIGDAIMAIWNAPFDLEEHGRKGCETAIEMIKKLQEINVSLESKGFPKLQIGVGLNSGEAVVGNMGANVRFDYTAIGDTVNLAARLEGQTKNYGVSVIISKSTVDELPEENINSINSEFPFFIRELDYIQVKGKQEPIMIYHLFTRVSDKNRVMDMINRFNGCLDLYRKREFEKAQNGFKEMLVDFPNDGPCELYIARCDEYIQTPPPEDWNYVYTATSK